MGHEIPLAKYAEPRIRSQLAVVRSHALAAARRLDLHDKAATAWRHAFEPIQLSDSPAVWLQMTPQSVSFAGMRANSKTLRGSIELAGTAQTIVGQDPPAVTATALPTLGQDVDAPGAFDVILPVRVGYDVLKDRLAQAIAAMPPVAGISVRDIDVYPSSGKLVVGLRVAKAADTDPNAGKWVYLSGAIQVDADGRAIRLSNVGVMTNDEGLAPLIDPIAAQLGSKRECRLRHRLRQSAQCRERETQSAAEGWLPHGGKSFLRGAGERLLARRWRHDRTSRQWRSEDPVRHVSRATAVSSGSRRWIRSIF